MKKRTHLYLPFRFSQMSVDVHLSNKFAAIFQHNVHTVFQIQLFQNFFQFLLNLEKLDLKHCTYIDDINLKIGALFSTMHILNSTDMMNSLESDQKKIRAELFCIVKQKVRQGKIGNKGCAIFQNSFQDHDFLKLTIFDLPTPSIKLEKGLNFHCILYDTVILLTLTAKRGEYNLSKK